MARKQERIVDDQIRTWRFEQQALNRRSGRSQFWPIITISREFGAQGHALAEALCERIGFTLWDRELVQSIAEVSGGDEAIVAMLDERHRKAVDEMVFTAVIGARHTNARYFNTLLRVVHAIEQKGGSVIVGRGASYICEADGILSVRVVCPLEERIRALGEREDLTPREAERLVDQRDRERAEFVRAYFRADVAAPTDYDVLVNSGSFSLDAMVDIVLAAYEAKFDRRPSSAARSDAKSPSSRVA